MAATSGACAASRLPAGSRHHRGLAYAGIRERRTPGLPWLHATDYYGVDPRFGTITDLQQSAIALHAHGMKLVLDTVPTHVGPGDPWVSDEPKPNWFHGAAVHHIEKPALTGLRIGTFPYVGRAFGGFNDELKNLYFHT